MQIEVEMPLSRPLWVAVIPADPAIIVVACSSWVALSGAVTGIEIILKGTCLTPMIGNLTPARKSPLQSAIGV
jgi:hypothetical protein